MNSMATEARANAAPGTTYQQQAYDYLKAQILSLRYRPGQYITDSEVAEALEISRTPVREALRRLQQEHLLVKESRRGWRILSLSLQDIRDIFEIKILVEGMLARRAAQCTNEKARAALADAMRRMEDAAAAGDYEGWRESDLELHRIMFGMCPNERAGRIIKNLNDQWYRVRVGFLALEGRVERSTGEHKAIVSCVLARDGDGAERHMHAHLSNVREELEHVLNMVMPFVHQGL
jgi:DNA-binding GntR family transcriptional regulator